MGTEVSLGDSLLAAEQVLFRQLDQEAVLLNLKSGTYFGLNDVGARMWALIVSGQSLSHIVEALEAEYDGGRAEIERDLLELARQLVAKGLASVATR